LRRLVSNHAFRSTEQETGVKRQKASSTSDSQTVRREEKLKIGLIAFLVTLRHEKSKIQIYSFKEDQM